MNETPDREQPSSIDTLVDTQLRIIEHLRTKDLSLIVLKGHLLIEGLLRIVLKSRAKHTGAIDQAGLRFYQLAQMAKAFHYEEKFKPVWDAIFALNQLRNMFSHDLEAKKLDQNLRDFAHAISNDPKAEEAIISNPEYHIRSSVEFICGLLAALSSPRDLIHSSGATRSKSGRTGLSDRIGPQTSS